MRVITNRVFSMRGLNYRGILLRGFKSVIVGIRSDFNQNKFSRNTYFRMLKDQDFIQREMHNFELDKEHQKVVLRQNTKKCTNQRFIFPQPCMHHHKSDLITQNCCPSKGASLNTLNRISGFVLVE